MVLPRNKPLSQYPISKLPSKQRRRAIICDLDKTLANPGDRDPWDQSTCVNDTLNSEVLDFINSLRTRCGYELIILTARPAPSRAATARWLKENNVRPSIVFHKPRDQKIDGETALQYKERILREINLLWQVEHALDDEQEILDMYRRNRVWTVHLVKDNKLCIK